MHTAELAMSYGCDVKMVKNGAGAGTSEHTGDHSSRGSTVLLPKKMTQFYTQKKNNNTCWFAGGRAMMIRSCLVGAENVEGRRALRKSCRTVRGRTFVVIGPLDTTLKSQCWFAGGRERYLVRYLFLMIFTHSGDGTQHGPLSASRRSPPPTPSAAVKRSSAWQCTLTLVRPSMRMYSMCPLLSTPCSSASRTFRW